MVKRQEIELLAKKFARGESKIDIVDLSEIRKYIDIYKDFGNSFCIDEYIKLMYWVSIPQTYGNRIPKFLDSSLEMKVLSTSSGGDRLFRGKVAELKSSIAFYNKPQFNFRQVRLFEDNVETYLLPCFYINESYNVEIFPFVLSKDDMKKQKGSSCHKRAEKRFNDENHEIGLQPIKIGSKEFNKWKEEYLDGDLIKVIESINK